MRYEFRPLEWTGPTTDYRQPARFRATYPATLELLFSEAEKLGAEHLVLQVDIRDRDIRTDGLPRANARYGTNPGVIMRGFPNGAAYGSDPGGLYRRLAKRMHPDAGGDPADWDKLDQARNLLVTAGLL